MSEPSHVIVTVRLEEQETLDAFYSIARALNRICDAIDDLPMGKVASAVDCVAQAISPLSGEC